jgi:1-acyl-sn-glycerol-3-phosphate acyltransferase
MRKLIGYLLSIIYYFFFGLALLIFHPIQWMCLHWGGYEAHKRSVEILNGLILHFYYLLGNTVTFINKQTLPTGRPMIFVANHQSMWDIPPMIYHLRKHHGKFISKIELASGIPSISFNLRHGGAANIDRKDPKQSVAEIIKLGQQMQAKKWSAFIFPEGTRAKDGVMKTFQVGGIATLLKKAPDALIVPIAINQSWKMVQYGFYPLNTFLDLSWEVLEPIEPAGIPIEELVRQTEEAIRRKVIH